MTEIAQAASFFCPSCHALLQPAAGAAVTCPTCRWRGEAFLFSPAALRVNAAELALPDDAACAHHPRKRATAICAGTGDYICSLCAVEVDGQVYSAGYLNSKGKQQAAKAFDRYISRPDRHVNFYLVMPFIPYVNVAVAFAFLWIPHGFCLYVKSQRLRKQDELYDRLVSRTWVVLQPILLSLYALGWLAGVIAIILAIWGKGS